MLGPSNGWISSYWQEENRLHAEAVVRAGADPVESGAQVVFEVSFEREGTDKPVCVAENVVRLYTG